MYVDSEMDGYQVKEICSVLCEPTDVHLDYSYLLRDHERTLIKHLELFFRTFFLPANDVVNETLYVSIHTCEKHVQMREVTG